jgi:nucleoid-associated protein YgaU
LKPENTPQTASAPAAGFDNIPLGDVARHYRLLKLLEEQRDAANAAVLPGTSSVASPIIPSPASIPLKQPDPERRLVAPRPKRLAEMKAPSLPAAGQVVVRKGDSLWKLAEKYLGNGTRWQAILQVNPQLRNPNLIQAGDHLRLPATAVAQASGNGRVQKGDSLWKLAEVHFGSGACWVSIAQANPQISNPSIILPGQQILYPEHCSSSR